MVMIFPARCVNVYQRVNWDPDPGEHPPSLDIPIGEISQIPVKNPCLDSKSQISMKTPGPDFNKVAI